MKNLLVFSRQKANPSLSLLTEMAIKQRVELTIIDPYQESLPSRLNRSGFNAALIRTTGVQYDDYDLDFAQALDLPTFNRPQDLMLFRDKLKQQLYFESHQFPVVPGACLRGKSLELPAVLNNADDFIAKPLRGNQGLGVILFHGLTSLSSWAQAQWAIGDQRWLIQPYREVKREYRFFILKNEVQAGLVRKPNPQNFKANLGQGGKASAINLLTTDLKLQELVNKVSLKIPLHFYAIDIIESSHGHEILEINSSPGLGQVTTTCGPETIQALFDSLL